MPVLSFLFLKKNIPPVESGQRDKHDGVQVVCLSCIEDELLHKTMLDLAILTFCDWRNRISDLKAVDIRYIQN